MSSIDTNEAAQAGAVKSASPMLRSAKVVCQSGEYVCLVRDVSEAGTLLSFLHKVPAEPRIILSLGNGQTYPIQRIWAGKEQAGYRFAASVAVDEFLHESAPFNVRPVRLCVEASARVIDGTQSQTARLLDMSTHGAKFGCSANLPEGRVVSFQAHGMGQRLGQIVWRNADDGSWRYGLQFQAPLTLRELAQATLRMQPFGPSAPKTFGQALRQASAA